MVITIQPTAVQQRQPATPPTDLYVCPFTVLESNAEQTPWTFQGITTDAGRRLWVIPRKRLYMKTADYSIEGCENQILIERKGDDFLSSITTESARLRREFERMAAVVKDGGFACMVVESCLAAICDELDSPASERKITSDTVIGWCASWVQRYGVPVYFAGDRRRAELLAFRILVKWYQEHGGSKETP